ncbi:hypothetical protein PCC6912_51030 [Chlorogloeopsis fritschii PCC 6912]|uniref:Uncharacterized protein n=1 Tax=Chlorogloeopsis fritschii PCC 6912 TaxID=211165 RepID=A0A433N1P4_CHLFR|nr:hypothetical protein [Chlorogloeopsis fritschii]RUR74925.1 hypothetical protein PCC6912_51030 [Chlorogloeopsis fritschii PCC 6912]
MLILAQWNEKNQEWEDYQEPEENTSSLPKSDRSVFTPSSPILTAEHVKAARAELREQIKVQNFTNSRLLQILGSINFHTYHIATAWGALIKEVEHEEDSKNKVVTYYINRDRLQEMLYTSDQGELEGQFASTEASKYFKRYWPQACHSRRIFRLCRDFFRCLGIMDCEPGIARTREIPVTRQINLKRMLILYEVVEDELRARGKEDLLPKHNGANVIRIFDAVFDGVAKFRRPDWKFDLGAYIHQEQLDHTPKREIIKPQVFVPPTPWREIARRAGVAFCKEVGRFVRAFPNRYDLEKYLQRRRRELAIA